jgi:uncharacterized RDD family membrane protein YckC
MSPPPPVIFKTMSFEGAPSAAAPASAVPAAAPVHAAAAFRLVAGGVDLAVGAALFVLTAATIGTLDTSHGFVVRLDGVPTLVWIAAVLLSCFLPEALTGRTLGKALLGLRVVRAADGGHPSAPALAARTLLRIVDGLPFFYALGVLVMLVTPGRQRIGDLAARTIVVRAHP